MKNIFLIVILFIITILVANPYQTVEPVFEYSPISMISNFYDLSFTSAGDAVNTQLDNAGGGTYYVFQAMETAASTCRIYYAYLDTNYNLVNLSTIGVDDFHETKPALAIDPETGDPIVAWNRDDGIVCSYDLYHLGCPGLWIEPFYIFDENIPTPNPDDDFKDPIVKIGSSPQAGKRRVYVLTKNYRSPTPMQGYDLALLQFADFDVNDFNMQSALNWSQHFIIDLISLTHTNICFSFAVAEEIVSIMGYDNEGNVFILENDNYGEGDFTLSMDNFKFPINNPLNLDGTSRFSDDQGNPYEIYFKPMFSSNSNAVISDDNIFYPVSFGLAAEPDIFPLEECFLYPKLIKFDISTEEFSFFDLLLEGVDPDDNNPAIPWDIDEDGQVDSYDTEGKVDWIPSWPIFYHENTSQNPENLNNMRVVENNYNGTITIFWNDGTKAHFAQNTNATTWQNKPEIITLTMEGDMNFYDAQYLNSIVIPELAEKIPEFFYPSVEFVNLGNATYSLNAMFYDANVYCAPGQNNGGTINAAQIWFIPDEQDNFLGISHPTTGDVYSIGDEMEIGWYFYGSSMAVSIDLMLGQDFICRITDDPGNDNFIWTIPNDISADSNYRVRLMGLSPPDYYSSQPFSITNNGSQNDIINIKTVLYQNYPNPFNPSTTISFNLTSEITENTEISIYNSKGQKVRTFPVILSGVEGYSNFESFVPRPSTQLRMTQAGKNSYSVVWNGKDDNNKPVASGVYLYKLKAGEYEETKKMLLLR